MWSVLPTKLTVVNKIIARGRRKGKTAKAISLSRLFSIQFNLIMYNKCNILE